MRKSWFGDAYIRNFRAQSLTYLLIVSMITGITGAIGQTSGEQSGRVNAVRIAPGAAINIDGVLDDSSWHKSDQATGFVIYEPDFGQTASQQTIARFCYSDYGLYIGLEMLDKSPDSIFTDLSIRDDMGNADWIGVVLSPSVDGQNGFRFQVSAAGVQYDAKIIQDKNDEAWDAVWYSQVLITPSGWTAEMLIPWSAIRFSNEPVQEWDMNIIREIRRFREQSTWHPVDRKKHGFLTQSGRLAGLEELRTPVRLALLPYASAYMQKASGEQKPGYYLNAGVDVKYGILNNYTLDVTLIPDFGQVRSDDEIYNFSPDEVRYNENRPFFTEGTELFEKAGIFYSRRIGQRPANYYSIHHEVGETEMIIHNPIETPLINATKFSGRNHKGFAIGLFNAMTGHTYAMVQDTATGIERQITSQHFTNYNMVVLDQSLPNNSFVHLANTNVLHKERTANVTAATFQINDKNRRFAISGNGMVSQKGKSSDEKPDGYRYGINMRKISGHFRWTISHVLVSAHYDPNDMGYLARNNSTNLYGELGYYRFTPIRNMLNYNMVISGSYNMLQQGFKFTHNQINFRGVTTYRNRLSLGSSVEFVPGKYHDYYEARTSGRVYIKPGYLFGRIWLSPDYRKKFLTDINLSGWRSNNSEEKGYAVSISPRLRLTPRSFVVMQIAYDKETPSIGYQSRFAQADSIAIRFGKRAINNLTTSISGNYVVNPLSSFSLRIRHYWVTTQYQDFYELSTSGYLEKIQDETDRDFSVNFFTIDFGYSWNLAPGSYLHLVYKNAINNRLEMVHSHYLRNWEELMDTPGLHSFSVKLIYYIDYETTRQRLLSNRS
jgi:hypothetical protein